MSASENQSRENWAASASSSSMAAATALRKLKA